MTLIDWVKNNWNHPAQGIAAIASAVLSFADPPAQGIAIADSQAMLRFSRVFIIPVVWLILSVPSRAFARKRHSWKWFWVSIIMFFCAVTVWVAQRQLYAKWTCHSAVANRDFTIGKTFTSNAIAGTQEAEQLIKGRKISEDEARQILSKTQACVLVDRAEQNPNNVWEAEEILFRRIVMSVLYIAGIPIFVVSLISALQGWYCIGQRN